jgi:hypothetical protein
MSQPGRSVWIGGSYPTKDTPRDLHSRTRVTSESLQARVARLERKHFDSRDLASVSLEAISDHRAGDSYLAADGVQLN